MIHHLHTTPSAHLNKKGRLLLKRTHLRGTWVAQSVKCPTSAQVTISRFMSLSPVSGSVLTAQTLEPASDSVFLSLSAPPLLILCLSLSVKNILKKKQQKKNLLKRTHLKANRKPRPCKWSKLEVGKLFLERTRWGTWVAQLVERLSDS